MTPLFHGPVHHWAMLAIVLGLLGWMGMSGFHTHHFNLFLISLIGISLGVVAFAAATYRKGEPVTREPFNEDEPEG